MCDIVSRVKIPAYCRHSTCAALLSRYICLINVLNGVLHFHDQQASAATSWPTFVNSTSLLGPGAAAVLAAYCSEGHEPDQCGLPSAYSNSMTIYWRIVNIDMHNVVRSLHSSSAMRDAEGHRVQALLPMLPSHSRRAGVSSRLLQMTFQAVSDSPL